MYEHAGAFVLSSNMHIFLLEVDGVILKIAAVHENIAVKILHCICNSSGKRCYI